MGVSLDAKKEVRLHEGWICYSLNHQNPSYEVPIILIERGPKSIADVKRRTRSFSTCIILLEEKGLLLFKSGGQSHTATLENDAEYRRIASILRSADMAGALAQDDVELSLAIRRLIGKIPNATGDFVNKGLFSTHYLRGRIFDDTRQDVDAKMDGVGAAIGDTEKMLQALGWDISNRPAGPYYDGTVSITTTKQDDFSIRENDPDIAPSYTAASSP